MPPLRAATFAVLSGFVAACGRLLGGPALAAVVDGAVVLTAAFAFAYLVYAMLRPERF